MIVGGVQDRSKANSIQLLFYKQEALENTGQRPSYEIKVESHPESTSDKSFELILNQAQMNSNAILRTVITFEDTYQRLHFVVQQDNFTEDKLYQIDEYPEALQREFSELMAGSELESTPEVRRAISAKMSHWVSA